MLGSMHVWPCRLCILVLCSLDLCMCHYIYNYADAKSEDIIQPHISKYESEITDDEDYFASYKKPLKIRAAEMREEVVQLYHTVPYNDR